MTTLNEILSVPQFKGLKLLNSNGDLSAEVTNLDITENNDIKHFTSNNSFIFLFGTFTLAGTNVLSKSNNKQ